MSRWLDQAAFSAMAYMGSFWQLFIICNFIISIIIALLPIGKTKIGSLSKPEHSNMQWVSMILCTMLSAGLLFSALYEPMYFYKHGSHYFQNSVNPPGTAIIALSQTFLNHSHVMWSLYGTLSAFYIAHLNRTKGLPIAPRTMFYPIIGKRGVNGVSGRVIDIICIFAIIAGTALAMSFATITVSSGLSAYFTNIQQSTLGFIFLSIIISIYTISAVTGVKKGIRFLSTLNIRLAIMFLIMAVLCGPTYSIFQHFFTSEITEMSHAFSFAVFYDGAGFFSTTDWMNKWHYFFVAYYLSFLPTASIFILSVSQGRSIRSVIFVMSILAPMFTHFWYSMSLSTVISSMGAGASSLGSLDISAMVELMTAAMPVAKVFYCLFFLLASVFTITTADSVTFVISEMARGKQTKNQLNILYSALLLGILTVALYSISGSQSIDVFKNIVILSALPVTVVILPATLLSTYHILNIQVRYFVQNYSRKTHGKKVPQKELKYC